MPNAEQSVVLYLLADADAVPMDRVLDELAQRGQVVTWRSLISSDEADLPTWRLGSFIGTGAQLKVDAGIEPLIEALRTEALGFASTAAHRDLLGRARSMVNLSVPAPGDHESARLMRVATDALLVVAGGTALLPQDERIVGLDELRRMDRAG